MKGEEEQEENEEDKRVQVAPYMEAGGSYLQATIELEEEEATEEERQRNEEKERCTQVAERMATQRNEPRHEMGGLRRRGVGTRRGAREER